MIKMVSKEPLRYADEKGDPVQVFEIVCPEHYNILRYVVQGKRKIAVAIPTGEMNCPAWRKALEAEVPSGPSGPEKR